MDTVILFITLVALTLFIQFSVDFIRKLRVWGNFKNAWMYSAITATVAHSNAFGLSVLWLAARVLA